MFWGVVAMMATIRNTSSQRRRNRDVENADQGEEGEDDTVEDGQERVTIEDGQERVAMEEENEGNTRGEFSENDSVRTDGCTT